MMMSVPSVPSKIFLKSVLSLLLAPVLVQSVPVPSVPLKFHGLISWASIIFSKSVPSIPSLLSVLSVPVLVQSVPVPVPSVPRVAECQIIYTQKTLK